MEHSVEVAVSLQRMVRSSARDGGPVALAARRAALRRRFAARARREPFVRRLSRREELMDAPRRALDEGAAVALVDELAELGHDQRRELAALVLSAPQRNTERPIARNAQSAREFATCKKE